MAQRSRAKTKNYDDKGEAVERYQHLFTPEVIELLVTIVSLLLLLATPWLIMVAKRAAKSLADLSGVKVTAQQEAALESAVRRGVSYAEEQAHKLVRGLAKEGPQTGLQKLEVAKSAARSIAPKALRDVGDRELEVLIEAEVHERKRFVSLPGGALVSLAPPPLPAFTASPSTGLPPLSRDMFERAPRPVDDVSDTTPPPAGRARGQR